MANNATADFQPPTGEFQIVNAARSAPIYSAPTELRALVIACHKKPHDNLAKMVLQDWCNENPETVEAALRAVLIEHENLTDEGFGGGWAPGRSYKDIEKRRVIGRVILLEAQQQFVAAIIWLVTRAPLPDPSSGDSSTHLAWLVGQDMGFGGDVSNGTLLAATRFLGLPLELREFGEVRIAVSTSPPDE